MKQMNKTNDFGYGLPAYHSFIDLVIYLAARISVNSLNNPVFMDPALNTLNLNLLFKSEMNYDYDFIFAMKILSCSNLRLILRLAWMDIISLCWMTRSHSCVLLLLILFVVLNCISNLISVPFRFI
jgi:hypothetical protein